MAITISPLRKRLLIAALIFLAISYPTLALLQNRGRARATVPTSTPLGP